jgi:hypothetical protein
MHDSVGVVLHAMTDGQKPLTSDEWQNVGRSLATRRERLAGGASRQMWEIGDWLRSGEEQVFRNLNRSRVRELASELSGYSRHTLRMAVSVARRVDPSVRVDGLSWWHHLCVANRTAEEQQHWLTRAAEEGWPVAALRKEVRRAGVDSGHPRRSTPRPARVVGDLLMLRRDDIPDDLIDSLRRWWQTEMRS